MRMIMTILILIGIVVFSLSGEVKASSWEVKGYVEGSVFPQNKEYDTHSTLEVYLQVHPKDFNKWFIFTNPVIFFGEVAPRIRDDNTYITSLDLGIGYISEVKLGIGYQIGKNIDVRLLYWNTREPRGYEGDWTGLGIRWTFGK